jgi:hypothetical protein
LGTARVGALAQALTRIAAASVIARTSFHVAVGGTTIGYPPMIDHIARKSSDLDAEF